MKKLIPSTIIVGFCLVFLIFVSMAELTFSATLNHYPRVICSFFRNSTGLDVTFESVDFRLLSGLRFKNVFILKGGKWLMFIKRLQLGFSWPRFLFRRQLGINQILLENATTPMSVINYKDYLTDGLTGLQNSDRPHNVKGLFKLTLQQPKISIKNLQINFFDQSSNHGFVVVNSKVKMRRENLFCTASIDFSGSSFNNSLLRRIILYKFSKKININMQLAFMKDDLLVNNVAFSADDLKINGSGIIYNFNYSPVMDIKFITAPLNIRELLSLESKLAVNGMLNIVANLKGGLRGLRLQTEMMMNKSEFYLPKKLIHLSNMFCNIQLNKDVIEIKELSCLVNYRYPVSIHGTVSNFNDPEFNLRAESFKIREARNMYQEVLNWVFKINSKLSLSGLVGSAKLFISVSKSRPHYKTQKEINIDWKDLKLTFQKVCLVDPSLGYFLKFTSEGMSMLGQESVNGKLKNSQELNLDHVVSNLLTSPTGFLTADMRGLAYQGVIESKIRWNGYDNSAANNFLSIKFIDLSVADLRHILPVYSDISGNLNGVIYISGKPPFFLDGAITVTSGTIKKLSLIDNIADFLGIKSIKELSNILLSVEFAKRQTGIRIKRLNLHNEKLNLDSTFLLNNQEWINGLVFLSLPKNVLEESEILRKLMSMVQEGNRQIDFGFRVSGFPSGLRVELLEGEFREKLIKGLSGNILSQIEKEIDRAMTSFKNKDY